MSMPVSLYAVPLIDPEHRNVVFNMPEYLETSNAVTTRTLGDFIPSLSNDFTLDVVPVPFGRTPTYAAVPQNDYRDGVVYRLRALYCFVLSVEQITPDCWRLTLRADWWANFMDGENPDMRISGSVVRSTAARYLSQLAAATYLPPVFANVSQSITPAESNNYRLGAYLMFTTSNRVTGGVWVCTQSTYEGDLIAAAAEILSLCDTFVNSDGVTSGIASITNVQVIPSGHVQFYTGGAQKSGSVADSTHTLAVYYMQAGWYDTIGVRLRHPTVAGYAGYNNPGRVRYFGNFSKLLPMHDGPTDFGLWITSHFAGDRLRFTAEYDGGYVDITEMTTVPTTYNDAAAIAMQNKTSDALRIISSGVGLAAAAAGTVASGGAMAAGLIQSGAQIVSTVNDIRNRPNSTKTVLAEGFWDNVTYFHVFGWASFEPTNLEERAFGAIVDGYVCSGAITNLTVADILSYAPADHDPDDPIERSERSIYERIQFADDVAVVFGLSGTNPNGALPDLRTLQDIRTALVRGVAVWGDPDTLRVGDYAKLMRWRYATA